MEKKSTSKRVIKRVLDYHQETIAECANVVGMGICRLQDAVKRKDGYAIAIYVSQKLPPEELSPEDMIPPFLKLKTRDMVIMVPTKVIEIGEVSLNVTDCI